MHESLVTGVEGTYVQTLKERYAMGKALRRNVSRSCHAHWAPAADRPDPCHLLAEQNRSRLASLVPLRAQRMAVSPFTFFRGSAIVMAQDLASTPVSGIQVQICGDAHLNNFGIYATPERNQVFDVNDFDETLAGPWEWDIKRLGTSIVLAGRSNHFSSEITRQAVLNCVQAYRDHMWKYSTLCYLDAWYSRIDYESSLQFVRRMFHPYLNRQRVKASQRSSLQAFPKLVTMTDGRYQFKEDPPLISHLHQTELVHRLGELVDEYKSSLQEDRRILLSKYHVVDVAQKVVGVGSVGTRCYVVLLLGSDTHDPLLLQMKEAQASVLERHLGPSIYPSHAQRVVCGQRLMQAASDLFLGWTRLDSTAYYIRQFRDMKVSVNIETLSAEGFIEYCRVCGWALARAHARSGDPALISGYLGKGSKSFDCAIAAFATCYADQAERDYALFISAL